MQPYQLRLLRSLAYGSPSSICRTCVQRARQLHALRPLRAQAEPQQKTPSPPPSPPPPPASSPPQNDPLLGDDAPKPRAPPPSQQIHRQGQAPPTTPGGHWKHPGYIEPLGRPIGSAHPPDIHDNSPIDTRDFTEKYKDFTNVEKHLAKREKIKSQLARPYFRDWKNLAFEKGKLWLGNEKLWRGDVSLWMPNLVGDTLVGEPFRSTTEMLRGKVSLVAFFQRDWAQKQAETWFSAKDNPVLAKLIEEGRLNLVQINVEDAPLARSIQGMFRWFMRRGMDKRKQENYFFVKEVPDSVVEEIGILNSRVGYVYLVDPDCKIRWAGCAEANEGEKDALNKGAESLIRRAEMVRAA